MSRIRTIKPGFFIDEDLAELTPLTRLLFIGLWTIADRDGRLEDRPKRIRAQLHPYDDGDTDAMLQSLHASKFITRYTANGGRYIEITNFQKHQRITGKEAETDSLFPKIPLENNEMPPGNNGETSGKQSGNIDCFTNVQEGKGKERKGKEERDARETALEPKDSALAGGTLCFFDLTPERLELAKAQGHENQIWIAEQTLRFVNHYRASPPSAKAVDGVWLNWLRKGRAYDDQRKASPPSAGRVAIEPAKRVSFFVARATA